jgi:hypothetical protein
MRLPVGSPLAGSRPPLGFLFGWRSGTFTDRFEVLFFFVAINRSLIYGRYLIFCGKVDEISLHLAAEEIHRLLGSQDAMTFLALRFGHAIEFTLSPLFAL